MQEMIHRTAWKAAVLGTLNAAVRVLAARNIVLVATLGAIFLTWLALRAPDPYRLGALAIYALGVLVPAVWLASK